MSDKVETVEKTEDLNSRLKAMSDKELRKLHGEASREFVEIAEAADNPKDHADAHIDWSQAAKELEMPEGEVKERFYTRREELEKAHAELYERADRERSERAKRSDVSNIPETGLPQGNAVTLARPQTPGLAYAVSREDERFQQEFRDRKSYREEDNDGSPVVETFKNARFSDIFAAPITRTSGLPTNDDIDHGRPVVAYNDPRIAIGPRLQRIGVINGGSNYTYWKETGAGGDGTAKNNTIDVKAENTKFAEQEMGGKKVTVNVEKITGFSQITDEELADVNVARAHFNTRFRRNFEQKMEQQIVAGSGSSNQWDGLLTQANRQTDVVTKASAAKPNAKKLYDVFIDAWQKLVGGAYVYPDLLAMPSLTLATFAKKKDQDNNYIWSSTSESLPMQMFGIPVAISEHITANNAIMLALDQFAVLEKEGIMVQWGLQGDDFVKGLQTLRGTCRGNVVAFRENCLVHMSGLDQVDVS